MPIEHIVAPGECISSVAYQHGFFWETLWNHGDNAGLKKERKDPNVLHPGDVVVIPDLTVKEESCATEQVHEFRLKGVPARLNIKVVRPKAPKPPKESPAGGGGGGSGMPAVPGMPGSGGDSAVSDMADPDYEAPEVEEEPVAIARFVFEVEGGVVVEGRWNGEGEVKVAIVPNAREGRLIFNRGESEEFSVALDLGGMDPVSEVGGLRKRLANLGFFCNPEGPEDGEDLKAALRRFQEVHSLEATGKADDKTRSKLEEVHGC